jgi:hypothetical protein
MHGAERRRAAAPGGSRVRGAVWGGAGRRGSARGGEGRRGGKSEMTSPAMLNWKKSVEAKGVKYTGLKRTDACRRESV